MWINVISSDINCFKYIESELKFVVNFNSGGTYEYYGVPKNIYVGILYASSKGKYFHKNIKHMYRYKKI